MEETQGVKRSPETFHPSQNPEPRTFMAHSLSVNGPTGGMISAAASTSDTAAVIRETARLRAFTDLWQRSQRSIRAYLASFIPDGSLLDDCVQEVAMVAWRKSPVDAGESAFLGHCLACARHIGMAARRKKHGDRLQLLSPEVAQALADTVAARERPVAHDPSQRIEALRNCLDRLKPDQRELIELRYGGDLSRSLTEEAKVSGKSLDSLYKRLERLRTLLRQCVSRQLSPQE